MTKQGKYDNKSKPLIIWEMINYVKFCCARKSWPSLEEFVGVLNSLFPDFCRIFLIWTTNHNENGKIKEIIDTHLLSPSCHFYKIESGSKIKMEIWHKFGDSVANMSSPIILPDQIMKIFVSIQYNGYLGRDFWDNLHI